MCGAVCTRIRDELAVIFNEPIDGGCNGSSGEKRLFAYNWLLILIALVTWMEPDDYKGMNVDVVKIYKGTRYQNLRWVKEADILKDCAVQFWIYWEAL